MDIKNAGAGIGIMMQIRTAHNLMNGAMIPLDDFSYHYYSGVSKRLASMMPAGHWSGNDAHTGKYLASHPLRPAYMFRFETSTFWAAKC